MLEGRAIIAPEARKRRPTRKGSRVTAIATVPTMRKARLEARLVAFLVDSVVLLSFVLVLLAVAGLQLLLTSDLGKEDPPDSSFYAILGIVMAVIPLWLAFNVVLCRWRGQTVGKYVADIKIVREDGRPLDLRTSLIRFLVLHPLLFHPFLALLWLLTAAVTVSVTLSVAVLVVTAALVFLSLAAPFLTAGSLFLDGRRRALHDRVAGTTVVLAGGSGASSSS
jgi:uncharacterized RDD family membrane protein YckC